MELNDIKENYRNFEDYKIEQIATDDVTALRPGVIEILKDEIRRRKLPESLIDGIDIQTRELTEKEFNEYSDLLRKQPCPKCNSHTKKLNATMVGEVISFLIMTNYDKRMKIGCSDCLDEFNDKATKKSALLGWWGIPWGPVKTIQSFIFNSKNKKNNHSAEPSDLLQGLIFENIGYLEANKKNPEKLKELINKTNDFI